MRRLVDIFVILVVVGVVVFVVQSRPSPEEHAATVADVQDSLARLYERAAYHGALDRSTQETSTLWPVAMLPEWFGQELPVNGLLSGVPTGPSHRVMDWVRPWIDVAPPGDKAPHPPDPVAVRRDQAQFWYNPNIGVFRARVGADIGEDQALLLYNELNGVEVAELHRDTDPARVPHAYTPGTTPSATMATQEPKAVSKVTPAIPSRRATPTSSLFVSDPAPKVAVEPEPEPTAPPARSQGRSRMKDQTP